MRHEKIRDSITKESAIIKGRKDYFKNSMGVFAVIPCGFMAYRFSMYRSKVMSDIEREAFEQAVKKEFPGDYSFDLSSRGDYCDDYPLTTMWWVWQAARQGLEGCEHSGVWQFYQNGKWSVGSNTHNHRGNTEKGGFPTRDLYTHPVSADVFEGEPVGVVVHRTDPRSDNPDAYIDWTFGGDIENLPDGMKLYKIHGAAWRDAAETLLEQEQNYE